MATLFKNARFITDLLGNEQSESTCLVVKGGVIELIGSESDTGIVHLSELDDVQQVDVGGKLIIPSFIDAHVHLLQFGISLSKVDVRHCASLAQIRGAITVAAKQRPNNTRLLFQGWRHAVTGSNVTASMLDNLDPRPIYIDSVDLHSTWCNTAALEEMDLESKCDLSGGKIHRDENGVASGLLEEAVVITIVWPFLGDALSKEEKLDCLRTATGVYNDSGYTAVIDMAMDEKYFNLLTELQSAGELSLRIAVHFLVMPSDSHADIQSQVERVIELHNKYNKSTSPDLRIAGIKIVCDGVIDACTAAISRPYSTTKEMAPPMWSPEALQVALGAADAAGLQCAMHAIGDGAVSLAINGVESLSTTGRRHRIERLELTKPEDAKRLGQLGITASIQPVHCDPELKGIWPGLIGHDHCGRAFAYSEFHQHGASLAIGSDAPTAPHVPWNNLFNATTQRSFRRPDETDTANEHFRLKLRDALIAMSLGGAYSCFAEDHIGGLEAEKQAYFLILANAGDWESEPTSILSSVVDSTWLGGKMIYQRS